MALGADFDLRVARACRRLGLPSAPTGLLEAPVSRALNLLTTLPELEPGLAPLAGPVAMVGPCLPRARAEDASVPALTGLPDGGKRVYVSLGTVFNGKPEVFRRILDGLEGSDTHVVVSAGASFEALARAPRPRVHVFRRVPQLEVLRRVDVVVTHGGNNTVQECLAAGRPMVVVPFGGDQVENARRVGRLGVGVALSAGELTPDAIRAAVAQVSGEPYRARALAIANVLGRLDGAAAAVDAIVALLASGR